MSANPGKASIMQDRKIQQVEVPFISDRQKIYEMIDKHPGIKRAALKELVEPMGVSSQTVNYTLRDLLEANYIKYARGSRGAGDSDTNKTDWRWSVTQKEYKPQTTMRKVAPNDKKALKSIEKMTTPKHVPETMVQNAAPKRLEIVQGMASIDANDPHFAETAKGLIDKVTAPLEPLKNEVPVLEAHPEKPITTMWFEVGTQTLVATPQQAYQLYRELDQIFGIKQ